MTGCLMVVVHFAKQNEEEEDRIYTIISNNLTHQVLKKCDYFLRLKLQYQLQNETEYR